MSGSATAENSFARFIEAIRPGLPDVVVIGGWAHRLFRLHPRATGLPYPPLMTRDADVAVGEHLRASHIDIGRLLREAGFVREATGDHVPPVTRYRLADHPDGFYVEFLTPLSGDGLRRDGRPDVTVVVAGIAAQKLRHLGILLESPWPITIGAATGFPLQEPAVVRVPNPGSFLAQKLLIHARRGPGDRAKDILYIYDTIELFSPHLDEIRTEWAREVLPELHITTVTSIRRLAGALFREVTDDARRAMEEAAAAGRDLQVETVTRVGQAGLERIFR